MASVVVQTMEETMEKMMADPTKTEAWSTGRETTGAQGAAGSHINAKTLTQKAPYETSLLMHATYGVANYPQYFQKWPDSQLDEAIEVMERQLATAKAARDERNAKRQYVASYVPAHPDLRTPTVAIFAPNVVAAFESIETNPNDLRELLDVKEETDGVFSFDLLHPETCADLNEEFQCYVKYRDEYIRVHGTHPPGTLRERLQLTDCGLENFEAFVFEKVAKPIALALFGRRATGPEKGIADLDASHAYTIGYGPTESRTVTRKALIPHVDDCEVTLNVCLTAGFDGGGLQFHGKRNQYTTTLAYDLPKPNEYAYHHRLGKAVIHLGSHFHEVLPVTHGERHVLIFWLRSWRSYRASHCPCCLKFRRDYCVCSPEWN